MLTEITYQTVDSVLIVGASNGEGEYILWQVREDSHRRVHFEWNDQANSGYDIVSEVTVDLDGCHMVVAGQIVSFYWQPPRHPELGYFVSGLRSIYRGQLSVLEVHDTIPPTS